MSNDPYDQMRWTPMAGEGLIFDEQYRAAHLPLVAPGHPRTLVNLNGRDYHNGWYARARVSIVADLGRPFLAQDTCRHLLQRLATSSFAEKVAFDLIETRAPNIHCTLIGDVNPTPAQRNSANQLLRDAPSLMPVMHGPFIGQFNRGRIYFPLEFTRCSDRGLLDAVCAVFGRNRQQFTAIGLVNLRDELDPQEAYDLAKILADMKGARTQLPLTTLSWTSTNNDLTLEMSRLETIPLATQETA
ncbi:hypothetical protein [Leifsonia sp. ZF2019]|uniref:hypothetical protein n=1 Tax=Leifsonia sp. ZF2019 TaxID=2781978 RepID=UPI001CBB3369|nr:hypothetical protein [Leifsonia sp. ZF2019]